MAKHIATRTSAIENAFHDVIVPYLEAGGLSDVATCEYLASTFCEEMRVALNEPEYDGDSEEETKAVELTKAQRHARNKALKRKGGARAAKGEGTFRVKRTCQIPFQTAEDFLTSELPEALCDAGVADDDTSEIVTSLLDALVGTGAVRDADDDAFDLITDEDGSKMVDHEPTVGASCVALLQEDDEWHVAIVRDVSGAAEGFFVVEFTEYAKQQRVARKELVLDVDRADLVEELTEGTCEMCERDTALTAHHLIPRQMHSRYLKKGLTQEFLNTCAMICRKCHNVVHRFKTNAELARDYSTLHKLLAEPYIQRWVAYAQKIPARTRAEARAHLRNAK